MKMKTILFRTLSLLLFIVSLFFFITPFFSSIYFLSDPALSQNGASRYAKQIHRSVSSRYVDWSETRIGQKSPKTLKAVENEWPLFEALFYLWASENLYDAGVSMDYAQKAIENAAQVIADPSHGRWVKKQWGESYLEKENIFYRMVLIGGLTSYQKITGDTRYESVIRSQTESMARELDFSSSGLLNDYPNECYPSDVLTAIAMIQRADMLLGMDHSSMIQRAVRGFQGEAVTAIGLPPYQASLQGGKVSPGSAKGSSTTLCLTFAPELWPQVAEEWYRTFEKHFWQQKWGIKGFREEESPKHKSFFANSVFGGPVIGDFGSVATAFGVASARANGRFDHAAPLSGEVIVGSWPLPNGILLLPSFLSSKNEAPLTGEMTLLFIFSQNSVKEESIPGSVLTPFTCCALFLYLWVGVILLVFAGLCFRYFGKSCSYNAE